MHYHYGRSDLNDIEESRECTLNGSMIGQIEKQQTQIMAEMLLEMQNRDTQLSLSYAGTESEIAKIKQRVIRAAQHFASWRNYFPR